MWGEMPSFFAVVVIECERTRSITSIGNGGSFRCEMLTPQSLTEVRKPCVVTRTPFPAARLIWQRIAVPE